MKTHNYDYYKKSDLWDKIAFFYFVAETASIDNWAILKLYAAVSKKIK